MIVLCSLLHRLTHTHNCIGTASRPPSFIRTIGLRGRVYLLCNIATCVFCLMFENKYISWWFTLRKLRSSSSSYCLTILKVDSLKKLFGNGARKLTRDYTFKVWYCWNTLPRRDSSYQLITFIGVATAFCLRKEIKCYGIYTQWQTVIGYLSCCHNIGLKLHSTE